MLAAAFLAEAAVAYGLYLQYWSSAILFGMLGVAVVASLGFRERQYTRIARWLPAAFLLGVVAEMAMHLAYSQSF